MRNLIEGRLVQPKVKQLMVAGVVKPGVEQLQAWVVVPPNLKLTTSVEKWKVIVKITLTMNFTFLMRLFRYAWTLTLLFLQSCCSPQTQTSQFAGGCSTPGWTTKQNDRCSTASWTIWTWVVVLANPNLRNFKGLFNPRLNNSTSRLLLFSSLPPGPPQPREFGVRVNYNFHLRLRAYSQTALVHLEFRDIKNPNTYQLETLFCEKWIW